MASIGKRNSLLIIREAGPGLYLDAEELGEVLLPHRYVPHDFHLQDRLEVFLYRDSEDRLVATTEMPFAQVGDFAFLKVVSLNQQVGAFLDWGLPKDLLLPFREQLHPLRIGQRVVVHVYLDPKTNRVVATMRVNQHLSRVAVPYRQGDEVELLITNQTPLGFNAIVENKHQGLLYHDTLASPLFVGQRVKGFVRNVREGGKIDLSLDPAGYKRVAPLTDQIVDVLQRKGGQMEYDDDSSPEEIRQAFGVSKKAFKQALGNLYKARRIEFLKPGIKLLDNSAWAPGKVEED